MTKKAAEKYGLTDKQIERFCDKGCSPDCDKLLKEYVSRLKRSKRG